MKTLLSIVTAKAINVVIIASLQEAESKGFVCCCKDSILL